MNINNPVNVNAQPLSQSVDDKLKRADPNSSSSAALERFAANPNVTDTHNSITPPNKSTFSKLAKAVKLPSAETFKRIGHSMTQNLGKIASGILKTSAHAQNIAHPTTEGEIDPIELLNRINEKKSNRPQFQPAEGERIIIKKKEIQKMETIIEGKEKEPKQARVNLKPEIKLIPEAPRPQSKPESQRVVPDPFDKNHLNSLHSLLQKDPEALLNRFLDDSVKLMNENQKKAATRTERFEPVTKEPATSARQHDAAKKNNTNSRLGKTAGNTMRQLLKGLKVFKNGIGQPFVPPARRTNNHPAIQHELNLMKGQEIEKGKWQMRWEILNQSRETQPEPASPPEIHRQIEEWNSKMHFKEWNWQMHREILNQSETTPGNGETQPEAPRAPTDIDRSNTLHSYEVTGIEERMFQEHMFQTIPPVRPGDQTKAPELADLVYRAAQEVFSPRPGQMPAEQLTDAKLMSYGEMEERQLDEELLRVVQDMEERKLDKELLRLVQDMDQRKPPSTSTRPPVNQPQYEPVRPQKKVYGEIEEESP